MPRFVETCLPARWKFEYLHIQSPSSDGRVARNATRGRNVSMLNTTLPGRFDYIALRKVFLATPAFAVGAGHAAWATSSPAFAASPRDGEDSVLAAGPTSAGSAPAGFLDPPGRQRPRPHLSRDRGAIRFTATWTVPAGDADHRQRQGDLALGAVGRRADAGHRTMRCSSGKRGLSVLGVARFAIRAACRGNRFFDRSGAVLLHPDPEEGG